MWNLLAPFSVSLQLKFVVNRNSGVMTAHEMCKAIGRNQAKDLLRVWLAVVWELSLWGLHYPRMKAQKIHTTDSPV